MRWKNGCPGMWLSATSLRSRGGHCMQVGLSLGCWETGTVFRFFISVRVAAICSRRYDWNLISSSPHARTMVSRIHCPIRQHLHVKMRRLGCFNVVKPEATNTRRRSPLYLKIRDALEKKRRFPAWERRISMLTVLKALVISWWLFL
jgi:hypothetical protein